MSTLTILCTPYNSVQDLFWQELDERDNIVASTLVDTARERGFNSIEFQDFFGAPETFRLAVSRLEGGDITLSYPMFDPAHLGTSRRTTFLGHHSDHDVYFSHDDEAGFHGIVIISGNEDWQWDSGLLSRVRQGDSYYREGGPWHFGLTRAEELGLA